MEYTIDGETYWLPDNLPDDMTRAQMRALAVPMRVHKARLEKARLEAEIAAHPTPSDDELVFWARENHPSAASLVVLNRQLAEQIEIIGRG